MVVAESEAAMSSPGEAESSPPLLTAINSDRDEKAQNSGGNPLALIGRQSSIYSLTLDEFQHTLSESGKNFGSMNMDEFLTSIWTAEENQHSNVNSVTATCPRPGPQLAFADDKPSLSRQGSLSLPAPLSRKTVEEVWSEIHKKRAAPAPEQSNNNHNRNHHDHHQHQHQHHRDGVTTSGRGKNVQTTPRQPTFGEMTLEDFLIKAGVVREQAAAAAAVGPAYPNSSAIGGGVGPVFAGNNVYRGRGGNGFAVSPVSSDGMCGSQAENSGGLLGLEMGVFGGRKRNIDGPVEKVVERRQRRMIKNRESAARSRARKQAYTVELEAELNQLKEENTQLKQTVVELERKKKQQYHEEMKMKVHNKTKAYRAKEKLRVFRRNLSCPL